MMIYSPPPPVYVLFIPVVNPGRDYVCTDTMCDYMAYDGSGRAFVTDEGIYTLMTERSVLTLRGVVYAITAKGSDVVCPDNMGTSLVFYIHMDGVFYYSILEVI